MYEKQLIHLHFLGLFLNLVRVKVELDIQQTMKMSAVKQLSKNSRLSNNLPIF